MWPDLAGDPCQVMPIPAMCMNVARSGRRRFGDSLTDLALRMLFVREFPWISRIFGRGFRVWMKFSNRFGRFPDCETQLRRSCCREAGAGGLPCRREAALDLLLSLLTGSFYCGTAAVAPACCGTAALGWPALLSGSCFGAAIAAATTTQKWAALLSESCFAAAAEDLLQCSWWFIGQP